VSTVADHAVARLGRQSAIVRTLQPLYGLALRAAYGRSGLPWQVNGEVFKIDPQVRRLIPHENETALFAFLRESIRPGQAVFDIGSFLGIYAMLEARLVGPAGRVIAFEPSAPSFEILVRHVQMNGLAGRLDARCAAVGARRRRGALIMFDDEPYRNLIAAEGGEGTSVDLVTVDDVCDATGLTPDWIRMDVQGLEFDVLRGAARTLRAARGRLRIVAEMHPAQWPAYGLTRDDVPAVLEELGVRARGLSDPDDPFQQDGHAILEPD
jgi:FkbM family methyltransferase